MPNAVTPVVANNSRHSREGGNPVYLGVQGCTGSLDSRLRGNDGEGGLNSYVLSQLCPEYLNSRARVCMRFSVDDLSNKIKPR